VLERLAAGMEASAAAVAWETARLQRRLERRMAAAGLGLADVLSAYRLTEDAYAGLLVEEAAARVRRELALDALADDDEGIQVDADECDRALARRARRIGMSAEAFTDWLAEQGTTDLFRRDLRRVKALQTLIAAEADPAASR
jgi:trigger factor